MSDFGAPTSHPSPRATGEGEGVTVSSWRNVLRQAIQQSRWTQKGQDQQTLAAASNHISSYWSNGRKRAIFVAVISLLAVVLLFVIVRFALGPSSVNRGTAKVVSSGSKLLGLATTNQPKPSPSKPMVKQTPQAQLPPSPWISVPSSPPIQLNTPMPQVRPGLPAASAPAPSPMPNPAPAQPATGGRPQIAPVVYRARHDKHFGGSCLGQLTLNSAGLVFDCPSDPNESFQVGLNEIGAVDDNGVRLLSGKKYHFSISGMSKSAEEVLFGNWLHQVR